MYNEDGTFYYDADASKGLKEKGFEFIAEMERLGMVIDVSHLSDAGFWDIYNNTTKPFVASHSNARAMNPHVRNLTDDMIRAFGERGCITGLNYCGAFLNDRGDVGNDAESRIEDMVRHVKYITNLGGIDVMALGSDFDGIGGRLDLADASFPEIDPDIVVVHIFVVCQGGLLQVVLLGNVLVKQFVQRNALCTVGVKTIFDCSANFDLFFS